MSEEGMERVYRRHEEIGDIARRGAEAIGLELFADASVASNTVTAIKVPRDLEWPVLSEMLHKDYGVVLAGGQGDLSGKVFRIGHLGWVSVEDIEQALVAVRKALARLRSEGALRAGGS